VIAVPADSLRDVPVLASLKDRDRRGLAARMHERRVAAGERIMGEGAPASAFYLILDGEAEVSRGPHAVGRLGPGEHLGEMALLDERSPRSATVTAVTDVRLAHLGIFDFRDFVREHGEVAWELLVSLAERLRAAEEALDAARRWETGPADPG
jgi:CRP/FNR family cyclic AMP-dependent transcriptional regulator